MRKLITALPAAALMIASLAGAEVTQPQQSTNLEQKLRVDVYNVCTYKVDNREDVNGKTYYGGDLVVLNYKATEQSTTMTTPDYEYRCTTGTNFSAAGVKSEVVYINPSQPGPAIVAEVNNFRPTASNAAGDQYAFNIKLTAAPGQFNVRGGSYDAVIKTTVTYN